MLIAKQIYQMNHDIVRKCIEFDIELEEKDKNKDKEKV